MKKVRIRYSLLISGLLFFVELRAFDVFFEEVADIQLTSAVGQIDFYDNSLLVVHGKCIYLYPLGINRGDRILCFGDDSGEVSVREEVNFAQSDDNKYVAVSDKRKVYLAKWGESLALDVMDEFSVENKGICQFDRHSRHLLTKIDSRLPGLQIRKIQDDGKMDDCLWLTKQENKFEFSKAKRHLPDLLSGTVFKNEEVVDDVFVSLDACAYAVVVKPKAELNRKQCIYVLYQSEIREGVLTQVGDTIQVSGKHSIVFDVLFSRYFGLIVSRYFEDYRLRGLDVENGHWKTIDYGGYDGTVDFSPDSQYLLIYKQTQRYICTKGPRRVYAEQAILKKINPNDFCIDNEDIFEHEEHLISHVFSSNSQCLVIGFKDGHIKYLKKQGGRWVELTFDRSKVQCWDERKQRFAGPYSLILSRDCQYLAVMYSFHTVKVFRIVE